MNDGVRFAQMLRLRYTPRKLAIHPDFNTLIVAEADHGTLPWAERGEANGAAAMDADGAGAQVAHRPRTLSSRAGMGQAPPHCCHVCLCNNTLISVPLGNLHPARH